MYGPVSVEAASACHAQESAQNTGRAAQRDCSSLVIAIIPMAASANASLGKTAEWLRNIASLLLTYSATF